MDMKKYGLEEWAKHFEGRSKRALVSKEEETALWSSGFVVIWGESDDLMECRGAIREEYGTYEGRAVYLDAPTNECDDKECPYYKKVMTDYFESGKGIRVDAYWYGKVNDKLLKPDLKDTEWFFESNRPCLCFAIIDDHEPDSINFGLVVDFEAKQQQE